MFDIQYANRFGKREENMEELRSILDGIYDKLLPTLNIMYEWARERDLLIYKKYGGILDERTEKSTIQNERAHDIAMSMLYDPYFEKDKTLSKEDIKEIKEKRKLLVDTSNEIAIMVMQIDNVIEEIASRVYDEIFSDSAADYKYKEGLIRMKIDSNTTDKMMISLRGIRNKFCHAYGFHKIFIEMSIGKIYFHRLSIIKMRKMAKKLYHLYKYITSRKYKHKNILTWKNKMPKKIKRWIVIPS